MICDLCKERSDRIIRVASRQVCQWCVSNNVLEHALEVEVDIAKLKEVVAKTSAAHQRDVRNETVAKTNLEGAYAAYEQLTATTKGLAASIINSKESLKRSVGAKKALKDYKDKEQRKTQRARQHV